MHPVHPYCTPGLRFYQRMMEKDRAARLANQARLRKLCRREPEIEVFCGHDPTEFEHYAERPIGVPAHSATPRREHGFSA